MGIILGIGELLWDRLPAGPRMGGAPANFASHARALGADSAVISRVGADESGQRLIGELRALGVRVDGITVDAEHPTGSVEVSLGPDGQPEFVIPDDVAWDHLRATPDLLARSATADAVCFGSLGQRSAESREAIRALVAATPERALRVFDVNLRQNFFNRGILESSLDLANVCKLSDSELPVIAALLDLRGDTRAQLGELLARYQLRAVAYTRGSRGSILTNGADWCEHPGVPAVVRDTVGAGDSFTCAVTMGLLAGWPLAEISDTANHIAAHVCSQIGAVPELPPHLRNRFPSGAAQGGGSATR